MQGTLQRNLRRVPARKSKQATIYCQAPYTVEKVHKITYLTDRLDSNMICRSRWDSLVGNVDTGTLFSENYRKCSKFCALQGVQEQLYGRQEDLRIIHACVSLLGNVREIVIISWPGLRHNPGFVHGKQPVLTGLYQATGLHPLELFYSGRPSDIRRGKDITVTSIYLWSSGVKRFLEEIDSERNAQGLLEKYWSYKR